MDRSDHTPVVPLACTLVEAGSALHQILTHMEAFAAVSDSAADAPPRATVLRDLLCDVLAPALAREDPETLAAATRIVGRSVDAIADELLLVPIERQPSCSRRRRHRGPGGTTCR